jgi:hypothetical protein
LLQPPHDYDRGLRAPPRGKVAADPRRDGYVMSLTVWTSPHSRSDAQAPCRGGRSRSNRADQPAGRYSPRRPRCPLHASKPSRTHIYALCGSVAPSFITGAELQFPQQSARPGAALPATSCLVACRTPAYAAPLVIPASENRHTSQSVSDYYAHRESLAVSLIQVATSVPLFLSRCRCWPPRPSLR